VNDVLKKTTLVTAVVLITIVLSCTRLTSTLASEPIWGVTPGDTYDYDLNYVEIDYSLPPVEYNATGITFANDSFVEQNSIITFNVTNVNETLIGYDLKHNGTIENNSRYSGNFSDELSYLLNLPLKFALREANLSDIKRGFTGIDYLMIPAVNDTWDEFDQYDNPLYLAFTEEIFASQADIDLEGLTTMNQITDECNFEWHLNGTYLDEANGSNFQFVYSLKLAYEMSTGILLGMRVSMDIDGENNGDPTSVIIRSEVERSGYDLSEFQLPTGGGPDLAELLSNLLPGFGWIIVPIVFAPLILIKKRERK